MGDNEMLEWVLQAHLNTYIAWNKAVSLGFSFN